MTYIFLLIAAFQILFIPWMLILTAAGQAKVGLKCSLLYLGGCVSSFMEKGGV